MRNEYQERIKRNDICTTNLIVNLKQGKRGKKQQRKNEGDDDYFQNSILSHILLVKQGPLGSPGL